MKWYRGQRFLFLVSFLFLLFCILSGGLCSQYVQAAQKDVTADKKEELKAVVKPATGYLALYGVEAGKGYLKKEFKLDNLTKTNLVCYYMDYMSELNGESTYLLFDKGGYKSDRKIMLRQMKKLFGKDVEFVLDPKAEWPNCIYQNKKDDLRYCGGDWGVCRPTGVIKKIYQIQPGKFRIEYKVGIEELGENKGQKTFYAEFQIDVKEAGNIYGYHIKDIKCTKIYEREQAE